jgi:hypothetical protein
MRDYLNNKDDKTKWMGINIIRELRDASCGEKKLLGNTLPITHYTLNRAENPTALT